MKKLLLSIIMMFALSFSANAVVLESGVAATTAETGSSLGIFGGSMTMPAMLVTFLIFTQEEYRSCSDNKALEGSFSHGKSNHTFSIEPCDYLDNPSKYTLKSS